MTTQSAVAKSMHDKLKQFDDALIANGITLEYLAQRLKTIVGNAKSYGVALSAISMLLKQQQILVERSEVTVTDGLTEAHEALKAKRATRDGEPDTALAIDNAIDSSIDA